MKRYLLTILVPGLLLAMLTGAHAGVTAQSFSVSPYGGGTSFLSGQHLDTSPLIGVRGGYNFTEHFGIEAVMDYTNTDGNITHGWDVHVYNWHGDMLYNFTPEKRWVPYAVIGYGWQNRTYPHDNHTTRVGLNYGGGIKFFALPTLAVRADFRDLVMNHHGDIFHDLQYSAGVDILFGGVKPEPTVAAAVAPPPAPPQPKVMMFEAVALFDVDEAELKPEGQEQIKKYREQAQADLSRADKIVVTGHTDNTGSAEHNMELSKRRAEAVRDYLGTLGVDPSKIEVRGEGESKPIADNSTEEGRAKNRRVEIEVHGLEK